jgi:hypothetical protein
LGRFSVQPIGSKADLATVRRGAARSRTESITLSPGRSKPLVTAAYPGSIAPRPIDDAWPAATVSASSGHAAAAPLLYVLACGGGRAIPPRAVASMPGASARWIAGRSASRRFVFPTHLESGQKTSRSEFCSMPFATDCLRNLESVATLLAPRPGLPTAPLK